MLSLTGSNIQTTLGAPSPAVDFGEDVKDDKEGAPT
jgi:hypothetical protein